MSDVLVKVDNVSKRFCRSLKRSLWYGLQDLGSEIGGRRHGGGSGLPQSSADVQLRPDEFWAVKDVSFELRRGECLGLIGRNGAGKTTLLRMLNGLIKPDTGRIEMSGRVNALIALGAGFNPILSGRENIHVATNILGIGKAEANERLDEIIDFAELQDFIDSPVQSYSSGMQVRLGFAAAAILAPDILILDEVLVVGDVAFRLKCWRKVSELVSNAAVILVSHSKDDIFRLANKGILLSKGTPVATGRLANCYEEYERSMLPFHNASSDCSSGHIQLSNSVERLTIIPSHPQIKFGDDLVLDLTLECCQSFQCRRIELSLQTQDEVAACKSSIDVDLSMHTGRHSFQAILKDIRLKPGIYWLVIGLWDTNGIGLIAYSRRVVSVNILSNEFIAKVDFGECAYSPQISIHSSVQTIHV